MWKRAYVESQLGASFDSSDRVVKITQQKEVTATDGTLTLKNSLKNLPISCDVDSDIVWVLKKGTNDDWKTYDFKKLIRQF